MSLHYLVKNIWHISD